MNAPINDYDFQPVRPRPWAEFSDELLELYKPPLRAKATYRAMKEIVDRLTALGVEATAELTPGLVAKVITTYPPDRSPRTVRKALTMVRVIVNYAVATGCLMRSPFAARPLASWVRVGRPIVKPHQSREEIARLLAWLERDIEGKLGWARWRARRLYALAALIAYTGLRKGEALNLRVEDIRLADRVLIIRGHGGRRLKTAAAEQPVPLPAALVPILAEWIAHRRDRPPGFEYPAGEVAWLFPNQNLAGPWTTGGPGLSAIDRIKWAAEKAKVPNVTFHSLRRSLATHMEAHGLGQALITRVLRHTSERTSREWYQDADVPNLVAAVEDLRF